MQSLGFHQDDLQIRGTEIDQGNRNGPGTTQHKQTLTKANIKAKKPEMQNNYRNEALQSGSSSEETVLLAQLCLLMQQLP